MYLKFYKQLIFYILSDKMNMAHLHNNFFFKSLCLSDMINWKIIFQNPIYSVENNIILTYTRPILTIIDTMLLCVKKIQVCLMKGPAIFQGGKQQKYIDEILKNLLLRNYTVNFNQICTKHPWVKGIQVCSSLFKLKTIQFSESK